MPLIFPKVLSRDETIPLILWKFSKSFRTLLIIFFTEISEDFRRLFEVVHCTICNLSAELVAFFLNLYFFLPKGSKKQNRDSCRNNRPY